MTAEVRDSVATCAGCRGTAPRRGGEGGMPLGWYGLTVAVPEWYNDAESEAPYQWVGQFCGSACLIAYGPEIARMEGLARQAYEAAVPVPPPARNRKDSRP